ncbi:SMC-Scp complex subunit ScpB [Patescibacteria group bacterium]|nr:SMC-Scp complex subunit ScpB [Patescibacteria group bacterium]
MTFSHLAALQALLFAAGEALSKKRLVVLMGISTEELEQAIAGLHTMLEDSGLALVIAGEELELRTALEASPLIQKFRESELSRDLGKAGLETLSIILYKKGATRSEIDWVRGVNSATALRSLSLRGLVLRSEDAQDRRRIRYTATIEALAHLGVRSADELPQYEELTKELASKVAVSVDSESTESENEDS